MRMMASAAGLIALWLLMSGIYKPLMIAFGLASVLGVLAIIKRMDKADEAGLEIRLHPVRSARYFVWLMVEIAKANWAVTKIVLSPKMAMRQHLFLVPYTQKTDLAQVIFANSITLTPGTISVETEDNDFLVHALNYSPGDHAALADMDRRVSAIEFAGAA
jgi:multicomponent Na+:H+ antiporter subunit E